MQAIGCDRFRPLEGKALCLGQRHYHKCRASILRKQKPLCEDGLCRAISGSIILRLRILRDFSVEPRILAEAFLSGDEFTVSVLDGKALPVIQICPHSGSYDYHSKYTKGATDYLVPAPIPEALAEEMSRLAETGYRMAECDGACRFDFKTDRDGRPHLLEANSIPGMTATSLVPKAAAAAGISFPALCEKILLEAGLNKV